MEIVKSHLLAIEKEVFVKVGNKTDHTKDVIFRGELPGVQETIDLHIRRTPNGYYGKTVSMRSFDIDDMAENVWMEGPESTSSNIIRPQHHCRVVYKEYATPISDIESMLETVETLDSTTEGMDFNLA